MGSEQSSNKHHLAPDAAFDATHGTHAPNKRRRLSPVSESALCSPSLTPSPSPSPSPSPFHLRLFELESNLSNAQSGDLEGLLSSGVVDERAQPRLLATVEDLQDAIICYGELRHIRVSLMSYLDLPCSVALELEHGLIRLICDNVMVGQLRKDDATIVSSILGSNKCMHLECNLSSISNAFSAESHCPRASRKSGGAQVGQAELTVIVYGPCGMSKDVGIYLAQYGRYLQHPSKARKNTRYLNPQSLSIDYEDAPMVLDIRDLCLNSQADEAYADADPSSQLEMIGFVNEIGTPAGILRELYQHQRQALAFMHQREKSTLSADISFEDGQSLESQVRQYRGGILADDMGLGKTLSLLSLIVMRRHLRDRTKGGTLIVVPLSLLPTWEDQIRAHVDESDVSWTVAHPSRSMPGSVDDLARFDMIITTYDTVAAQWQRASENTAPFFQQTWQRIVLDEAHEIRSSNTRRAQAVRQLKSHVRWAVTGTPVQNRMDDLASLLSFLRVFPDHSLSAIRQLCKTVQSDPSARKHLTQLCLRRSKSVVPLPPRADIISTVQLSTTEQEAYEKASTYTRQLLESAKASLSRPSFPEVLVRVNTQRQICNLGTNYTQAATGVKPTTTMSPKDQLASLLANGQVFCYRCNEEIPSEDIATEERSQVLVSICGATLCFTCVAAQNSDSTSTSSCACSQPDATHGQLVDLAAMQTPDHGMMASAPTASSKISALLSNIREIPAGDKVLIFSFWVSTLNMIAANLTAEEHSYLRFDGSMKPADRANAIDTFTKDPTYRILLISLSCGSNGLNLTVANHVFLMEPQWNPMLEEQALSRVYRIGQTKPVRAVRFIVENSIEPKIRSLQAGKRQLAEKAFSGRGWVEKLAALTEP